MLDRKYWIGVGMMMLIVIFCVVVWLLLLTATGVVAPPR